MSVALRFYTRRAHGRFYPVHTADPDRVSYSMCGVEIDAAHMQEVRDPHLAAARACVRCDEWRELAEERAARSRGIVGGWESTLSRVTGQPAWKATDSLGNLWYVVASDDRGRSFFVDVVPAGSATIHHVRKLGAKCRARWKHDAAAMSGCEDLARSGEYLLDREKFKKEGAA